MNIGYNKPQVVNRDPQIDHEYGTIYCIENTVNGKRYVGQAITTDNWNWHRRCRTELRNPHNDYYKRAVQKHGIASFTSSSLSVAFSKEELDEQERYWIHTLNTTDPTMGYNLMTGGSTPRHSVESRIKIGEANSRRVVSEETRRRISSGLRGVPRSPSTRQKISDSHKGMTHSLETRKKLSNAVKGNTLSTEHRQKLSESVKRHWRNK